jgi:peroxiredoxin
MFHEGVAMRRFAIAAAVSVGLTTLAFAQTQSPTPAPELKVKAGDPAPDFSLPGTDGKTHKLSDYKGKTLVLAWFPKAFTGG